MRAKRYITAACVAFIGLASPAFAATVNVVHGINGLDVGTARELPVDIAVNGACSLTGVKFTQSAVVKLDPARYLITVHPSDGLCSQPPLISKRVTIRQSESAYSVVASLSSRGKPQLKAFPISKDISSTDSFAVFRHLAKAGDVKLNVGIVDSGRFTGVSLGNGRVLRYPFPFFGVPFTFKYSAVISSLRTKKVLKEFMGNAGPNRLLIWNIVGSQKNGLTVIRESFVR